MESQISVSLRKSVRLALVSLLTFVAFAAQPSSSWSQANDTSAAVTLVSPPLLTRRARFIPCSQASLLAEKAKHRRKATCCSR